MALRGINVGGWLVAERWMTPDLFKGVRGSGERALVDELGAGAAGSRLKEHRDTFITETDFAWIASRGFDFVRLPIGYWLFEASDGFISGQGYVDKAFQWASKHHLGIILDFHGLQGSQNGQDHSGQVGKVRFYRRRHRRQALATVEYLTKRYGQEDALLGIELINEPKIRWSAFRLINYSMRAYRLAQANLRPEVKIIVSDGFQSIRLARLLARKRLGEQLVLDVHLYQLFSAAQQNMDMDQHLEQVEEEWGALLKELGTYMPILVGEWSAALPNKVSSWQAQREFFYAQQAVFDKYAWAHCYWSYKAPEQGPWDFKESSF